MKKVLSLLIVSIMMLSLAACGGGGSARKVGGEITIGDTTELTGDWITTFQNNAADRAILNFISGHGTVDVTNEGEYVINDTVVKNWDSEENDDGSKTYTFEINKGLKFSNGEEMTSEHYVGAVLLWNHHMIREMEGGNTGGHRLVGHRPFASGETNVFSGVRLLGDYEFSLTISAENIPYFYETALVSVTPYYLPFWIGDDVEVLDDGEGAYFSPNLDKDVHGKILEAGRRNQNHISSGAYVVESYDEAAKTAVLKINEHFQGNYEGQKPSIETIVYKLVNTETLLDELQTGQVDLLAGLANGDEINGGHDLVDQGGYEFTAYPRVGYGKLTFVNDHGPTQFAAVRHAIAHLLDRQDFALAFTGGFGAVVNGPFGDGQWFYSETRNQIESQINHYEYSLQKANEILEADGWTLDKDGNEWKSFAESGLRHKDVNGNLMALDIKWASSQNEVADLLVVSLVENDDVEAAGMRITEYGMTFGELLNWLYRDATNGEQYGIPEYHMFNLGSGFNPMYDLSKTYSTDPDDIAMGYNTNFVIDEKLENLAQTMVLIDPTDREGFKDAFVDFAVYWNEVLPDLPLYSNIYHDFYNEKLKGYERNDLMYVDQALLYSWIEE